MILGIGTDILNIERFKKAVKKEPVLIERVFTSSEISRGKKLKEAQKSAYLAKRFAAKEAISKACGTGIGEKMNWQDIEISNTDSGQPIVTLSSKTTNYLKKHYKVKNIRLFLSLSDEKDSALAFAILESC